MSSTDATPTQPAAATTVENAIDQAKRAFALKKYEQAVEHYANALELMTKEVGEDAPETADLYFAYGKALLENAISQSSVLGKEQQEDAEEPAQGAYYTRVHVFFFHILIFFFIYFAHLGSGAGSNANGPILSFSGDAEDVDEDGEEKTVDLFAQAAADVAAAEEDHEEEEEGEDGEPEDDFNAAWEVLDLARAIYEKQVNNEGDMETKLKLADTYIALGDVSLETEKFDQAITDYEAGLKLKLEILPQSSRHIAEAHYKLSMVLDLTAGRLSDAIVHAVKALESVEARLQELRQGLADQLPPLPEEPSQDDKKGKGKATARLVRDDYVQKMTKAQIESELKELGGLRDDLALKVDELKTSPNESLGSSAPELAALALDHDLNAAKSSVTNGTPAPVNDLTSIVKKKKKAAPAVEEGASSKRKAEEDPDTTVTDKKVKLDTPEA